MRSYSTVFGLLLVAAYVTLSTTAVAQTSPPEQAEHPVATAAPVTSPEPGEHAGSIVGSVVSVSRQTMVAYVGTGPGLNFIHQGVGTRDISFSNFDYQTGLNFFTGVRFRRGTFAEIKTSLWARGVPTLRLMFGYTF